MKIWNLCNISINFHNRHSCIWLHISRPFCPDGVGPLFIGIPKPKEEEYRNRRKKKLAGGQVMIYTRYIYIAKPGLPQKYNSAAPPDNHTVCKLLSVHENDTHSQNRRSTGKLNPAARSTSGQLHPKRLLFNIKLSWLSSDSYPTALRFLSCLANFPSWLQYIRCGSLCQRNISEQQWLLNFEKCNNLEKWKFSIMY